MLALQQAGQYKRHCPDATLLYQLIEQYYPAFQEALVEQDKRLPKYIEQEIDGFMRVVCGDYKNNKLVAFSCKRRGF